MGEDGENIERLGDTNQLLLKHYLKLCLNNKIIDFVGKIKKAPHKSPIAVNINEEGGIDIGYERSETNEINLQEKVFVVGGIDIFEELEPIEKSCYILFLKGFEPKKLDKIYKKHFSATELINRKRDSLLCHKDELFEEVKQTRFMISVQ